MSIRDRLVGIGTMPVARIISFRDDALDLAPTPRRPVREAILSSAIKHTCGDRQESYGDPGVNLECAGQLKAMLRTWNETAREEGSGRVIGAAEQEAIDMICTKLARIVTGQPKSDTYEDGAAYFAIAGECGLDRGEISP